MFTKPLKPAVAAAFLASSAAGPAVADDLGAAIVGGVIGGVIVNEIHKNKQRQRAPVKRTYRKAPAYSAARAENRETQVALNYFGFPAGTADGILGRRSRAAIAQYQGHMGFPATGRLSPYERDFLVTSYSRAQIGGPQVMQAMQAPSGVRGLLHRWRNEATGGHGGVVAGYGAGAGYGGLPQEVSQAVDEIAASSEPSAQQLLQRSGFLQLADLNGDGRNDYLIDTSASGSAFWCGASKCSVMVFASTPQGYQRNDFLGHGVTLADFTCERGNCRMQRAGAGEGQFAFAAPGAPAGSLQPGPADTMAAAAPQAGAFPSAPALGAPALNAPALNAAALNAPALGVPLPGPAEPSGAGEDTSGQGGLQEASTGPAATAPSGSLSGITLFAPPATQSAPAASLTSHCGKVNLVTATNGGFVTAAAMTDPELALGEQFCLARSYALSRGEALAAKVLGLDQAHTDTQCDAFGPALEPVLARLHSAESAAVMQDVQVIVQRARIPAQQLAHTAAICLFSGYRRDDMDVALAAALLLTVSGQRPYGELVGHHLALGFGTPGSAARAGEWYAMAQDALDGGARPVFAPGQPERSGVIRAATAALAGTVPVQPVPAASQAAIPAPGQPAGANPGAAPADFPAAGPAPATGLPSFAAD
ncbi:peptidoglycan-binding domain-containing protein [Cribrihabitans pelagius]|uniref:peptidoglycan-binding domain-containing protein n=1 Tax=Cribrihabitans pelagius TaxID=1765746 RepID=UPI003B59CCD9